MMMDPDLFLKSQLKTLKDLGIYDGPLEDQLVDDGEYLCNTQEGGDYKDNQHTSSPHHADEYLCDTQEDSQFISPRSSPVDDRFNQQDGYSSPHAAYDSDGSPDRLTFVTRGGYHSPHHAPDDKFNYQQFDDDDGYTSPASASRSKNLRLHKSPYHSGGSSDESSPSLIGRSRIRRVQSYNSPDTSPLRPRRKIQSTSAGSPLMAHESDEEDMYGPGDPIFNVEMIHRTIGMEPFLIGYSGLPINWTDGALSGSHNLVQVRSGNPEFNQIYSIISKVGIDVKRVERIENKSLLDKYMLEIQHMKTRRKCSDKEKKDLAEEGLDQRLASRGHFGNGIYFSDDPRKCMEYIMRKRSKGQSGCILMCRVLLGDVKVYADGKQDPNLKREPIKTDKQRYDSVKGCVSEYAEYVTYTNSRALPEYFVTVDLETYKVNHTPVAMETKQQTSLQTKPRNISAPPKKTPPPIVKPKPVASSVSVPEIRPAPPKVKPKPTAAPDTVAVSSLANSTSTPTARHNSDVQGRPTTGRSDHMITRSGDIPVTWGNSTEDEWQKKLAKLRATMAEKKKKASPESGGSK